MLTPIVFLKAIILGLDVISMATDPAPWVYSPDDSSSYLARSDAITTAFLSELPFELQAIFLE